ncbi:MAG: DUF1858 domain-containing protein [Sulfurimonas sp.]
MEEITLETKIADLLNHGMKETLININPKFKKLNNPVLRRTVARVATVKQAAVVGGMEPDDLLNRLRAAVGQKTLEGTETHLPEKDIFPSWAEQEKAKISLDANQALDRDENPLALANKKLKGLDNGEILEIISDFRPQPLIDEFGKKGFEVAVKKIKSETFSTMIKKA